MSTCPTCYEPVRNHPRMGKANEITGYCVDMLKRRLEETRAEKAHALHRLDLLIKQENEALRLARRWESRCAEAQRKQLRLRSALEKAQWGRPDGPGCPVCDAGSWEGHYEGCSIGEALAGFREVQNSNE